MKYQDVERYDITIVGGGMVGMAAALALSKYDLTICLLENTLAENDTHPSYDDRTLVVNRASICFWKNLGVWDELSEYLTPINKVHVSNKGHFGTVVFDAKQLNVEALAYIVEAKVLGMALKQKIEDNAAITVICPANVTAFTSHASFIEVEYDVNHDKRKLTASLMLAADGVQSFVRKSLQLETQIKSYQRTAIICNITPELKHNNCAYERLTTTGPTALLPFVHNRCGFVWTLTSEKAVEILKLSDEDFIKQAQAQFGYRLGQFIKVGKRSSYPLYLVKVPRQVKSRVILLGNAAHSMSPVSAQGLNLAVRDVAMLVEVLTHSIKNNLDIGADETLNKYQQSIELDQSQTMQYTDDLMSWFKIDESLVSTIRSIGLLTLDHMPAAKSELFTRASGYRGKNTPQLLRYR